MASHQEKSPTNKELDAARPEVLEAVGTEHRERLKNQLEAAERQHKEKQHQSLEHMQHEAAEHATSLQETPVTRTEKSPAERRTVFSRHQREASFQRQMESVQSEMSQNERQFSKFIHHKTIESVSEAVGSTIARPSALLAGSICAFFLVTAVYLFAKHYGYQLSGFETIGAFALGWILGLIYDYIKLLTNGKKP